MARALHRWRSILAGRFARLCGPEFRQKWQRTLGI